MPVGACQLDRATASVEVHVVRDGRVIAVLKRLSERAAVKAREVQLHRALARHGRHARLEILKVCAHSLHFRVNAGDFLLHLLQFVIALVSRVHVWELVVQLLVVGCRQRRVAHLVECAVELRHDGLPPVDLHRVAKLHGRLKKRLGGSERSIHPPVHLREHAVSYGLRTPWALTLDSQARVVACGVLSYTVNARDACDTHTRERSGVNTARQRADVQPQVLRNRRGLVEFGTREVPVVVDDVIPAHSHGNLPQNVTRRRVARVGNPPRGGDALNDAHDARRADVSRDVLKHGARTHRPRLCVVLVEVFVQIHVLGLEHGVVAVNLQHVSRLVVRARVDEERAHRNPCAPGCFPGVLVRRCDTRLHNAFR